VELSSWGVFKTALLYAAEGFLMDSELSTHILGMLHGAMAFSMLISEFTSRTSSQFSWKLASLNRFRATGVR
jgi:hypothetical protein